MPGRAPGEYSVGTDEAQEFVSGALAANDSRVIGSLAQGGPAAFALAIAVPVGQQRALDRLLADRERRHVGTDPVHFTARWSILRAAPPARSIARLDLALAGRSLPRPVHARIAFDLESFGVNLWAACLSGRVLLLREPTFRRRIRGSAAPDAQTGLKIEGVGGCDVLRAALEKAGIADELFEGRHA
jgi:hypothetical protein